MDGKLSTGQSGGEGEAATCALAKNRYVSLKARNLCSDCPISN